MKGKILGGIIIVVTSILVILVSLFQNHLVGDPTVAYQVYLHGEKIGLINSKDDLYDLIDKEQTNIKEKYHVDKVYPPNGLDIKKVYVYNDDDMVDVSEIYRDIKDVEPFTIKGYTVKIQYNSINVFEDDEGEELSIREPVYLHLMDKNLINEALYNTVYAFLDEKEVTAYENGTQTEITDYGTIINSIYFDETITVKEDYISTEDIIFDNVADLSMYLLYGTLEKTKTYTVKAGDNLENIADKNKINVHELLIANPNYKSADILLAEGDVINVGYLKPLVSIVSYKTSVSNVAVSYKTTYVDDSTKSRSYSVVTTEGVDGVTKVTQSIKYINGEIQDVFISNREVIKEPVNMVITRGTKSSAGTSFYYNAMDGIWAWPTLTPYYITDWFGYRTLGGGSVHHGIDISGPSIGSPIYSATEGTVADINTGCATIGYYGSRCGGSYGNYVKVRTDDGYLIIYGHMAKVYAKVGDRVSREQVIGTMGSSGSSTGRHLHFEVRGPNNDSLYVNPCKGIFRC